MQTVAETAMRLDQIGFRPYGTQFCSQGFDMRIHGPFIGIESISPDRIHERGATEDSSRLAPKDAEQEKFIAGEFQRDSVKRCRPKVDVNLERAAAFLARSRSRAFQYSFDASNDFARTERLRNIVIATQFQTQDPVDFVLAGGEKKNRQFRLAANVPTEIEAIGIGESHIQYHCVD